MCGRFVSSTPVDELARYFGVAEAPDELLEPNYNVAPTTDVAVIHQPERERTLDAFHWGLVPRWAKDPSIGNRMINARAETLASKNAFKAAFKRRRCLIPVDGFYEWTAVPGAKKKQPWFIHRVDDEPMAFAGLWERWSPKRASDDDEPVEVLYSATIVTGAPNEKMARIHHRMPIILPPSAWDTWLDPEVDDLDRLAGLLVPAPSELITMHPVTVEVNNVRNKGPHLTDAVTSLDPDGTGEGIPVPDIDAGEPMPGRHE